MSDLFKKFGEYLTWWIGLLESPSGVDIFKFSVLLILHLVVLLVIFKVLRVCFGFLKWAFSKPTYGSKRADKKDARKGGDED